MSFNYTRTINTPDSDFDSRLRKKLDGVALDDTNFDQMSAEKYREFAEKYDADKQALVKQNEDAIAFIKAHPEYEDTTKNGDAMAALCKSVFGTKYATREQYEHCFPNGVATGLVTVKADVVKQQEAERAKAEATAQASLTEEESYSFDLNDLRLVADGQISPGEARKRHIANIHNNGF